MIIHNCEENASVGAVTDVLVTSQSANSVEPLLELEEIDGQPEQKVIPEPTLLDIGNSIAGISDQFHSLREQIGKHILSDRSKDEAFDRLYSELETYKKNSAFENVRPLFIDLILMFDRIANLTEEAENRNDVICAEVLKTVCDELLEIMYRRDIEMSSSNQETFDPTAQRAIGVERIECEEENNRIARIVRKGFRYGEKLLRPEEVIVKKYTPPAV